MDDLISRAAAIEAVVGWKTDQTDEELEMALRKVPTVDDAPLVHGRWEERQVDCLEETTIDAWQSARCSACGLYYTTPYLYSFTDYKFCPNCGARMDGESNG